MLPPTCPCANLEAHAVHRGAILGGYVQINDESVTGMPAALDSARRARRAFNWIRCHIDIGRNSAELLCDQVIDVPVEGESEPEQ
jgi:hypothetical protein